MSTGLIIAIVAVALLLLGLLVLMPRMRAGAERKKAERELQSRRETVAGRHREEAQQREREAERAEQNARIAQQQAEKERAEATLQQERAQMHDRGMADHELIDEHERDRFAPVTETAGGARDADRDGVDDRREAMGRDARQDETVMARDADRDGVDDRQEPQGGSPDDYERGRIDERREQDSRFSRSEASDEGRVR